jgi:hypothetical protein
VGIAQLLLFWRKTLGSVVANHSANCRKLFESS